MQSAGWDSEYNSNADVKRNKKKKGGRRKKKKQYFNSYCDSVTCTVSNYVHVPFFFVNVETIS